MSVLQGHGTMQRYRWSIHMTMECQGPNKRLRVGLRTDGTFSFINFFVFKSRGMWVRTIRGVPGPSPSRPARPGPSYDSDATI